MRINLPASRLHNVRLGRWAPNVLNLRQARQPIRCDTVIAAARAARVVALNKGLTLVRLVRAMPLYSRKQIRLGLERQHGDIGWRNLLTREMRAPDYFRMA